MQTLFQMFLTLLKPKGVISPLAPQVATKSFNTLIKLLLLSLFWLQAQGYPTAVRAVDLVKRRLAGKRYVQQFPKKFNDTTAIEVIKPEV